MGRLVYCYFVCISFFFHVELVGQIAPASSCTHTLQLFDSAANGWDGAYLDVSINNAPAVRYTISAAQGAQMFYDLEIPNGSIIDITYHQGANENEHTYILLDPLGAQLFGDGPFPSTISVPTIHVECPETCIENEDFLLLITMGNNPEQMSWELNDSSGRRVSFSNGNAYNGFPPGFTLPISMSLSTCEAYTLVAFDGANDGWNGGSFQLISDNLNRGIPVSSGLYAGLFEVLSGPGNFLDQASFNFTLPCFECGQAQTEVSTVASLNNCTLPGFIYPFDALPTPIVCYPHVGHGNPQPVMTVSYPSAIPPVFNAVVGAAVDLPVGKNEVIFNVEYGDGQLIRCTTEVNVVTDLNPTLVCNDNVNIALSDIVNNPTCEIEVTPDLLLEGASNCEAQYIVQLISASGENLGNTIDPSFSGQTLDYHVQHIASLTSCSGTITIEDKTAPHINCIDYTVACNHPNFMDENYTYTESYTPNDNTLPANIAGGAVAPSPPSITTLPVAVTCGPIGEIVKNVKVTLDINHTEIGDLNIELLAPNGVSKVLMTTGTCAQGGADNMTVVFDSRGNLPSIANSCMPAQTPAINGAFSPLDNISFADVAHANLAGEWQIIITDNNNTIFGDPVVGNGEVVNASIEIEAGFVTPFIAEDCSDFTTELVSEFVEDTNCSSPWAGAVVNRLWRATDATGNVSTCTQRVSLGTPSISDITLPQDIILECGETAELDVTGIPMFDCFEVDANQHVICDFTYLYEDTEVSSCGIGKKIFRDWTVINWCTTVTTTHRQVIEVKDTEGPSLGVDNIVTGTSSFQCGADIFLTALAVDACSEIDNITASYTIPGPIQNNPEIVIIDITNGAIVPGLPIGETEITVRAMDACGNNTIKIITVTIEDDTAPTAVCDDELRLSLAGGGEARLSALDIDEGSRDNCEIVRYQVRRLEACLPETAFGDFVEFECCDIGNPVNVELMVTDASGNNASCWLTVNVEDKLAPTISCPSDKAFTCEEDISDLSIFGMASAIDNCGATITESSESNIDNCGAGEIIRTFIATDDSGNSSQCSQLISLSHVSDFTVTFPEDLTLSTCNADISELEEPFIGSEDCELIAVSHEDQVFELVQDACTKIVRTWTIINWCIYENGNPANTNLGLPLAVPRTFRDDGDGFFQYTQVINIIDNEAPVFDPAGLIDITVEIESDCTAAFALPNISAFDDCSGDIIVQPNPSAVNGGHQEVFEITYVAQDGCGNSTIESINITFLEMKAPTPVCRSGLVAEIDSHLKEVTIWALDFESGSTFDNCTPYEELQFSFSENVNEISKTFNCDQIGINEIEIWVTDENGNQDFCITNLEIQDNLNACDSGTGTGAKAIIGGSVMNQIGVAITDVNMAISGSNTASTITDQNGSYDFQDLDVNGDYIVGASKNNDPLNGVSTFDLVLMARHILQVEIINDPYRLIASDVDNSATIDVFDLVAIRQLILRAIDEFPTQISWVFIDQSFVFSDPTNPWLDNFETHVEAQNLLGDKMDADFIGVKLGDLDNSAIVNLNAPIIKQRNKNQFELMAFEEVDEDSKTVSYSFYSQENADLQGFQFELDFDKETLNFSELSSNLIDIKGSDISTKFSSEGKLLVSWNTMRDVSVDETDAVFKVEFNYTKKEDFKQAITLSNTLIEPEIYINSNSIYELVLSHKLKEFNFEFVQNKPNPFSHSTVVEFEAVDNSPVEMEVFNLQGRLIMAKNISPVLGKNNIQFNASEFNGTGVYYLKLISGNKQSIIKMILVE